MTLLPGEALGPMFYGERPATLHLDGWAGRVRVRVTIIGETPKRYRIRFEEAARLPHQRATEIGSIHLVPKQAVSLERGEHVKGGEK